MLLAFFQIHCQTQSGRSILLFFFTKYIFLCVSQKKKAGGISVILTSFDNLTALSMSLLNALVCSCALTEVYWIIKVG